SLVGLDEDHRGLRVVVPQRDFVEPQADRLEPILEKPLPAQRLAVCPFPGSLPQQVANLAGRHVEAAGHCPSISACRMSSWPGTPPLLGRHLAMRLMDRHPCGLERVPGLAPANASEGGDADSSSPARRYSAPRSRGP